MQISNRNRLLSASHYQQKNKEMERELLELQKKIYQEESQEYEFFIEYSSRLFFFPVGQFYDLYFYGDGNSDSEAFRMFLEFICKQENADRIVSMRFGGPDEGANGTKNWDFEQVANSNVMFPNLKRFDVQLSDYADHNRSIIGKDYYEDGIIAKLLVKMPALVSLSVPSAPDKSFFEIACHPLEDLRLQAGYDNQNFIRNLAQSNNFQSLISLDYSDVMDFNNATKDCYTSFEDFKVLFTSSTFSTVRRFVLRNSMLNKEQLIELQCLNKNIQFMYVDAKHGQYVSHMKK